MSKLNLYNNIYNQDKDLTLQEKYEKLANAAIDTAFDAINGDTEILTRVLLKQGLIQVDEDGRALNPNYDEDFTSYAEQPFTNEAYSLVKTLFAELEYNITLENATEENVFYEIKEYLLDLLTNRKENAPCQIG